MTSVILAIASRAAMLSLVFASSADIQKVGTCIIIGIVIFVPVTCVVVTLCSALRNRKLDQLADAQHKRWRAEIETTGGELPTRDVPLRLKMGEACYFYDPTATLCELRAVRAGGYGGTSIRVARGVSIRTGRFAAESHDEWRRISSGALYVTNRRIIFDGAAKNRIIDIGDILSIAPGYREAAVSVATLQKPIAFATINGQIFADVVNTIRGADA